MSAPDRSWITTHAEAPAGDTGGPLSPRIFRVHGSGFWTDEVMLAPRTHTDERLAAVARMGYDAVWIHAELRQLAPTALFAEFEPDSPPRLEALGTVTRRAAGHGLKVWLYLCEPRSYPLEHPFWQRHPECRGQRLDFPTNTGWRLGHERLPAYGMCVRSPAVRQFLQQATCELFTAVPDLGGAHVITASEFHTHCFARFHPAREQMHCPRCAGRPAWEVVAEIGRAMQAGLEASGASGRLAFWDWAWHRHIEPAPQPNLLAHLPRQIALISVFEMGGTIVERNGKQIEADEYSFSVTGPTQQFEQHAALCRGQGREIWPKLQVSVTHELATLPVPLPALLYDKIAAVRRHGCTGALTVWTMGVLPTLNSVAAARLLAHVGELPPRQRWLCAFAAEYFGLDPHGAAAQEVVQAWDGFGRAMRHHPMETQFLYYGPINYAPAYPWTLHRTGTRMARSWTAEPWGDKLEMSVRQLGLGDVAALLDRLVSEWEAALRLYEAALRPLAARQPAARQELDLAAAAGLFFRSCGDCYAFAVAADRGASAQELLYLIERETQTCQRLLPLLEANPHIGWHDDIQDRMVDPPKVREKMHNLAQLRQQIDAGARA